MKTSLMAFAFLFASGFVIETFAETSAVESVKETGRDVSKSAKKGARSLKDKTCEMINGKLECAVKRVKHGAENVVDEVKDKADDK